MYNLPLISVVMSIFKEPEKWLRESIESVLNQTYKNFEFIIINDNPTRTINSDVLSEYKQKDDRILIISNLENIGLTKSLNKGLKIAKGKYIARMDGDDISLPDRFEMQIQELESDEKLVLLGTQGKYIKGERITNKIARKPVTAPSIKWILATQGSPIIHSSAIFRRFTSNGENILYNEEFRKKQDFELWSRLFRQGVVKNIVEIGICHRLHENQTKKTYCRDDYEKITSIKKDNLERYYKIPEAQSTLWAEYLNLNSFNNDYLKECIQRILPNLFKIAKLECSNSKQSNELKLLVSITLGQYALKTMNAKMYKDTFKLLFEVFKQKPSYLFSYLIPKIVIIYLSITHY